MKKIEFDTSKGRFAIKDYKTWNDLIIDANYYKLKLGVSIFKLSEITEEQASEIVESCKDFFDGELGYINYQVDSLMFNNPIKSLHSLLESKGIHLYENMYKGSLGIEFPLVKKIHDQKTFYNPYIFKI